MKKLANPKLVGLVSFTVMIIFYYGLLAATTGDFQHPFYFFFEKWYFLLPLFLGFGWQMLIFQKLRITIHENSFKMAGVSAGTSTVSMVACCAHHLAEIFPLLGLTGAATIVTAYQDLFLGIGVGINIIGIIYMQSKLMKHQKMAYCNQAS